MAQSQASHALLVSLRNDDISKTFSVDEVSHSMVWLGLADVVTVENAIAVILVTDEGLILRPARGCKLISSQKQMVAQQRLSPTADSVMFVSSNQASSMTRLHIRPVTEGMREYGKLMFTRDVTFTVGRDQRCGIRYMSRFVSGEHAEVSYHSGLFSIKDLNSGNGTLVNGAFLPPGHPHDLAVGDVVQVLDLTVMVGKGFLTCNRPKGIELRAVGGITFISHKQLVTRFPEPGETSAELELFYPAPRLSRSVANYELQVDDPPAKKAEDTTPFIMQLGPSMFMGISSIFMAASAISRISAGADLLSTLPQVAMSVSMLGGSLIWPVMARRYNRKRDIRLEEQRSRRYVEYLDGIENQLVGEAALQGEILRENRLPMQQVTDRAHRLSPFMMNRMSTHADFMELRVGMGDMDLLANVRWPSHRFSLSEDMLLNRVKEMSENPPRIDDVPMAFNPVEHNFAGIVGPRDKGWAFLRGLLIQIGCELTVGRSPTCDIMFGGNPYMGRKHLTLMVMDGEAIITDCGSANGTYAYNKRLTPKLLVRITAGNCFLVGGEKFYFLSNQA
ncbi:MAG: FHA domain-containing protein [Atopobiaceae bacterium]|nr:FHA domain-containing protein [Atopobiaceae bacterium]